MYDDDKDDDDNDDDWKDDETEYNSPDVRDSYRNHDNSDVEDELAELTNRNQITRRHKKRRNRFNEKYVDGIPRNLDWRKYGKSRH